MNMLEAFDPPFDMSQNVDDDCHDCAEHMHGHNHADCSHSSEREDAKSNACCGQPGNKKDEEVHMVGCSQHAIPNLGTSQDLDKSCNGVEDASATITDCFASCTDENLSALRTCLVVQVLSYSPPSVTTF